MTLCAAHILRFAPDDFAVEWLDADERWTRDPERAGNFIHLTEPQLDAVARRNGGCIPCEAREAMRTAPRWRDRAIPTSSL